MQGNEYQKLAMRTNDGKATERLLDKIDMYEFFKGADPEGRGKKDIGGIFNACLGLSGEVGELNDMVKKAVFHEHELDIDHVKKECGDIAWYLAMACESFGFTLDDVLETNIEKLKSRYPEGFDTKKSQNRAKGDI